MDIHGFLEKMTQIQNVLLEYIDDDENNYEKYQNVQTLLNDEKKSDDRHQLTPIIHLIASIVNYHHRSNNFFEKIFQIILLIKDELKKHYSNYEIFKFFSNNKRITLMLLEKQIIKFDKSISKLMFDTDDELMPICTYLTDMGKFFFTEVKQFSNEKFLENIEVPDNLNEIRKIEYGDNYILRLIQNDLIDEFIIQINQIQIDLNKTMNTSIFETNDFLNQFKGISLIDYSAFFGSVHIFKYLIENKCYLDPDIYQFAIHGRNPEIIHIIEDNYIQPDDKSYKEILMISIRCHHNELVDYLLKNYCADEDMSAFILEQSLKYYNYSLIQPELINSKLLYDLCENDYFFLAKSILQNDKEIDINALSFKEEFEGEVKKDRTALCCASEKDSFEVVELLLEYKDIDINKKSLYDYYGFQEEVTPLLISIKNGNMKIVQLLLNCNDIDVNMKLNYDKEQKTVLGAAIKKGNIDAVRLLIERNDTDINLRSLIFERDIDECTIDEYKDITPLYQAIERENYEIVQLLLQHNDIDINAKSLIRIEEFDASTSYKYGDVCIEEAALNCAVSRNQTKIALLLLSQININTNIKSKTKYVNNEVEKTLLHEAVINKNVEIVKKLLENKNFIEVNAKIVTCSRWDYFTELIPNNQDIWNEELIESIKSKIRNDFIPKRYIFASDGREQNEKNALYMAVEIENTEIVQLLLSRDDIDVNARSFHKNYLFTKNENETEEKKLTLMSPLYLAINKNNFQISQMLIEHKKIDINIKSIFYLWQNKTTQQKIEEKTVDKEETALHNAVSNNNLKIIELLLKHKNIDINITDKQHKKADELTNKREIQSLFKQ